MIDRRNLPRPCNELDHDWASAVRPTDGALTQPHLMVRGVPTAPIGAPNSTSEQ